MNRNIRAIYLAARRKREVEIIEWTHLTLIVMLGAMALGTIIGG